ESAAAAAEVGDPAGTAEVVCVDERPRLSSREGVDARVVEPGLRGVGVEVVEERLAVVGAEGGFARADGVREGRPGIPREGRADVGGQSAEVVASKQPAIGGERE